MTDYAKDARERYDNKQTTTVTFIEEVWEGIKYNAAKSKKHQHIVERATKAFLDICQNNNRSPVIGKAIFRASGIKPNQTSNHGLWPWLKGHADVIKQEKEDSTGKRFYSVPNDGFYAALRKVVLK